MEGLTYEKNTDLKSVCNNMDKLIPLVNHKVTKIERDMEKLKVDMSWIKKFGSIQTGLLVALFLSLLGIVLKLVL